MLQTASHLQKWAIVHVEDGFISIHELVKTVNRVRRVETIYTKDFRELAKAKAVILSGLVQASPLQTLEEKVVGLFKTAVAKSDNRF